MTNNQHIPIMVNEILSLINNKKNLSILDCTFGGGGHSKKFLEKGHQVTAIDQDDNSIKIAKKLKKNFPNIFFYKSNFKNFDLLDLNTKKFDLILLDLGFSSNQLTDVDIGLSFKKNSKLNMNYLGGDLNAYKIINYYEKDDLQRVFNLYGEINDAEKLAEFIIKQRSLKKINTNFEFIDILRESRVNFRSKKIHFATQAFQALRIESNSELENLVTFLKKVHIFLQINAYLAIISFHSLEDRIVKNYFRDNRIKKNKNSQNTENWGFEVLTKKPLTASKTEVIENNRARSAKLRVGRFIN